MAASVALGISHESIIEGLKTFMPIKGRGNFHHLNNGLIVVDDSYNANPDSVNAAIKTMLDVQKLFFHFFQTTIRNGSRMEMVASRAAINRMKKTNKDHASQALERNS